MIYLKDYKFLNNFLNRKVILTEKIKLVLKKIKKRSNNSEELCLSDIDNILNIKNNQILEMLNNIKTLEDYKTFIKNTKETILIDIEIVDENTSFNTFYEKISLIYWILWFYLYQRAYINELNFNQLNLFKNDF